VELNPGMVGQYKQGSIKNLTIAHLNIRSLKKRDHYIQVKNLVTESDFDIITISETWLNISLVHDSEIAILGYTLQRHDRQDKLGGGVCTGCIKKCNLGISQEIDIVLKTKYFRRLSKLLHTRVA
jgi:exonuclease III